MEVWCQNKNLDEKEQEMRKGGGEIQDKGHPAWKTENIWERSSHSLNFFAVKSRLCDWDADIPGALVFRQSSSPQKTEKAHEGGWGHAALVHPSFPSAPPPLFHAQSIWNVHVESIKASQMAERAGMLWNTSDLGQGRAGPVWNGLIIVSETKHTTSLSSLSPSAPPCSTTMPWRP